MREKADTDFSKNGIPPLDVISLRKVNYSFEK
jgi:hypothetical protein